MSNHAGYGSLVEIKEGVLNKVLAIYHANDVFPVSLDEVVEVPLPVINKTIRLTLDLFLESPLLELTQNSQGTITIHLSFTGKVKFELLPPDPNFPVVEKCLSILVSVKAKLFGNILTPKRIQVGIDFSQTIITAIDINIVMCNGDTLTSLEGTALHHQNLIDALNYFIHGIGKEYAIITPEILTELTDYNLRLQTGPIPYKVLQGVLAVAANILDASGNYITPGPGDPGAIHDFTQDSNMMASTHPNIPLYVFYSPAVQSEIKKKRRGVYITNVYMQNEATNVKIWGKAKKSIKILPDPSASFSMRARPVISNDQLKVDAFDVDISAGLWLKIIGFIFGVLSFGSGSIMAIILFLVISTVLVVLINRIEKIVKNFVEDAARAQRSHDFILPQTTAPRVMVKLNEIKIGTPGYDTWSDFKIKKDSQARIAGYSSIYVTRHEWNDYKLKLPKGIINPQDPTVRVYWELTQKGTPEALKSQDKKLIESGALKFSFKHEGFNEQPYRIFVRVYRNKYGNAEDLFLISKKVIVTDRLDQSSPFVRWEYSLKRPRAKYFLDQGEREYYDMGAYYIHRKSQIHRTDLPGRCKFADQNSFSHTTELFYMDELPFDPSEINLHRHEICEYCFFGGPDKTEPIIDL